MNKKIIVLILAVVFVLVLGGASVLYDRLGSQTQSHQLATQPTETEPQLIMAPDFTVYDADGHPVTLSQFVGKPIVLNFWASWCGPCKMEMPDFQAQYEALEGEVQFLMINMTTGRESMNSATAFLQEAGYTFPVYFDTQADAAQTYGAYSLPTTYFIDAQGYAIAQATGALDAATLQKGIDMIYAP